MLRQRLRHAHVLTWLSSRGALVDIQDLTVGDLVLWALALLNLVALVRDQQRNGVGQATQDGRHLLDLCGISLALGLVVADLRLEVVFHIRLHLLRGTCQALNHGGN